jgi:hypothetical protein
MTIGTRSLLFGVHQFALHPLCVAIAWWKLYGFPWDWRLWLCFLVHDWGYWGCADMDGDAGRLHCEWAAAYIGLWLDGGEYGRWSELLLFHSRHYANGILAAPSRLCYADKLAICYMPSWLYLRLARWSGELPEYMANGKHAKVRDGGPSATQVFCLQSDEPSCWLHGLKSYMRDWVETHK